MTIKEAVHIVEMVWDPLHNYRIDHNKWELAKLTILEAIGKGTHHLVTGTNVPEQPSVPPMPNRWKCRKAHEMIEDRLHCGCGCEMIITGDWDTFNFCPRCGTKAEVKKE